jgi:hypothetical protein
MANPFSNNGTVLLFQWGCFSSVISVGMLQWDFDTANLFIMILNNKVF